MAEGQHQHKPTTEMVTELAAAVGIEVPPELVDGLAERFVATLDAAAELRELDLEGVDPGAVFTMDRWQ
jgi:diphthamide synthase (EF-2-diphthine--ammonia ligase)